MVRHNQQSTLTCVNKGKAEQVAFWLPKDPLIPFDSRLALAILTALVDLWQS